MSNYETLDEYGLDKYNDNYIIHNNKFRSKKLPTNPRFYSYTEEMKDSLLSENNKTDSLLSENNKTDSLLSENNKTDSLLSENNKSTIIESVSPIPTLPLDS